MYVSYNSHPRNRWWVSGWDTHDKVDLKAFASCTKFLSVGLADSCVITFPFVRILVPQFDVRFCDWELDSNLWNPRLSKITKPKNTQKLTAAPVVWYCSIAGTWAILRLGYEAHFLGPVNVDLPDSVTVRWKEGYQARCIPFVLSEVHYSSIRGCIG